MSLKRILTHLYLEKISHLDALAKLQDLFDQGFVFDINLELCKEFLKHAFKEPRIYELFVANDLPLRLILRYHRFNESNVEEMTELLVSKGCPLGDIIHCISLKKKVGSSIPILLSNGITLEDIAEIVVKSATDLVNNPSIMAALLRESSQNLQLESQNVQTPEVCAMLFNRGMHWSGKIPVSKEVMAARKKIRDLESMLSSHKGKLSAHLLEQVTNELTDARNYELLCFYSGRCRSKEWKRAFNFALEENIAEVQTLLDKEFCIDTVTDEIAEMLWYFSYSKSRKIANEENMFVRKKIFLM